MPRIITPLRPYKTVPQSFKMRYLLPHQVPVLSRAFADSQPALPFPLYALFFPIIFLF